MHVGRHARVTLHARAAVKGYEALLGLRHMKTLEASIVLASSLLQRGGTQGEGVALLRRVLEAARAGLGDEHELTICTLTQLGCVLGKVDGGARDEAEALLRQAFETARRVHGDNHPATVRVHHARVCRRHTKIACMHACVRACMRVCVRGRVRSRTTLRRGACGARSHTASSNQTRNP